MTDTYTQDAFGKQLSSSGSTVNPYRYGGEWGYETEGSGLQQLGARFYWPKVGRFVQQDPIGDGDNWYAYAEDAPVVLIDPTGLAAGQSLRGHQRRGARGGAGLGGPGCKPKPKPKKPSRTADCKQCDSTYLQGWQAIADGIRNPAIKAENFLGRTAVSQATGHGACGGSVGMVTNAAQMTGVAAALLLNEKAYRDCCKKHHCKVLSAGELVPGARR